MCNSRNYKVLRVTQLCRWERVITLDRIQRTRSKAPPHPAGDVGLRGPLGLQKTFGSTG